MRLRLYKDGCLTRSRKTSLGVKALDNLEAEWRKSLEFVNSVPSNNAKKVERISETELHVLTDFDLELRFVLVDK